MPGSELSHTINKNDILKYLQYGNIDEENLYAFLDESFSRGKWLLNAGVRIDYLEVSYFDKLKSDQKPDQHEAIISPNENGSVIAQGYTLIDFSINYTRKKYEISLSIENLFNVKWNETQFNTESRLKNEPSAVEEIHFTPGAPFFARMKMAVFF